MIETVGQPCVPRVRPAVEVRVEVTDDGLEQVYARHATELTAFAANLVGWDDAADVVATTVARIVAGGRWHTVEQPRAYLYRSVYREAISVRRQFARRSNLRDRMQARHGAGDPVALEPPGTDPEVAAAIAALPVKQRAVVVLTYWQDLSVDDVADRLGIAPGTVKAHLARARASLRGALS